jgi:hypothetical protein
VDFEFHVWQSAYVNGQRQGVVLEKPFRLGDTIAKELGSPDSSQHKNTMLDIEAEIKLAFDHRRHGDDSASFSEEMKELGLERYTRNARNVSSLNVQWQDYAIAHMKQHWLIRLIWV